jgi:hypothetical protein
MPTYIRRRSSSILSSSMELWWGSRPSSTPTKHVLELQPLGGVQGGQLDLVELGVVLVEHGDQADGLDHVGQGLAVLLALAPSQPVKSPTLLHLVSASRGSQLSYSQAS